MLQRLGGILKRSFRDEDVVARWGGEEFFVGMYAMGAGDGVARLYRVLETVRQEVFIGAEGTSSTSPSVLASPSIRTTAWTWKPCIALPTKRSTAPKKLAAVERFAAEVSAPDALAA